MIYIIIAGIIGLLAMNLIKEKSIKRADKNVIRKIRELKDKNISVDGIKNILKKEGIENKQINTSFIAEVYLRKREIKLFDIPIDKLENAIIFSAPIIYLVSKYLLDIKDKTIDNILAIYLAITILGLYYYSTIKNKRL